MASIPWDPDTQEEQQSQQPHGKASPRGMTPSQTRRLLGELGARAKKSLGQHFLVDSHTKRQLVEAAALGPGDLVVEVGPGLGALTEELARQARQVVAIELDDVLAARLRQAFASVPNVLIIAGDVLEMPPAQILQQAGAGSGTRYKVVADLPYNIASAVLRRFLEAPERPELLVVMVQREVAENIVARPGDMRLLSVAVQLYGKASIVGRVAPRSFFPVPKVESAIVRIETYPQPYLAITDVAGFFAVVRAGFSARRKQLHNTLAHGLGLPPAEVTSVLQELGIDPRRRAQTLSLEEWGAVYRALRQRQEDR